MVVPSSGAALGFGRGSCLLIARYGVRVLPLGGGRQSLVGVASKLRTAHLAGTLPRMARQKQQLQRQPYIQVHRGHRRILTENAEVEGGVYRWFFLTGERGRRFTIRAGSLEEAVEKTLYAISTNEAQWTGG